MRCKACDKKIDRTRYVEVDDEPTDLIEELCSECIEESFNEFNYLEHEHMFEDLSEGPTLPKYVKY